jgi:hypothetical protein
MTTSNPSSITPSEFDDEVDDSDLPSGHIWAYPCKLLSCPDYGKSWQLASEVCDELSTAVFVVYDLLLEAVQWHRWCQLPASLQPQDRCDVVASLVLDEFA